LLQKGGERMLHVDLLVAGAYRFALCRAEGFLSFFREPIKIHVVLRLSLHPHHVITGDPASTSPTTLGWNVLRDRDGQRSTLTPLNIYVYQ
jgi:hypothetical protein